MPASISPSLRLFRSFSFLPRRRPRGSQPLPRSRSLLVSLEGTLFDNSSSFENSFESESKGQHDDSLSFLPERYPSRDMCLYKFVINSCTDFFYVFPRFSSTCSRMLFSFFFLLIINLIVEKCGRNISKFSKIDK